MLSAIEGKTAAIRAAFELNGDPRRSSRRGDDSAGHLGKPPTDRLRRVAVRHPRRTECAGLGCASGKGDVIVGIAIIQNIDGVGGGAGGEKLGAGRADLAWRRISEAQGRGEVLDPDWPIAEYISRSAVVGFLIVWRADRLRLQPERFPVDGGGQQIGVARIRQAIAEGIDRRVGNARRSTLPVSFLMED
jgi:hypothetical protein